MTDPETTLALAAANKATVERFWATLYDRDWEALAGFFTAESEYTDVPTPEDDVARGPGQILARLRLGLDPIEGYDHQLRAMIAEDDLVVTEHAEGWRWETGEQVLLPFTSVQEVRDGRILRWWDYWDLQTLLGAAPQWWIDHIMQGWR